MNLTFTIRSLADLAASFERRMELAVAAQHTASTECIRRSFVAEANAWREAAEMTKRARFENEAAARVNGG
jgi:hypothetical protein